MLFSHTLINSIKKDNVKLKINDVLNITYGFTTINDIAINDNNETPLNFFFLSNFFTIKNKKCQGLMI